MLAKLRKSNIQRSNKYTAGLVQSKDHDQKYGAEALNLQMQLFILEMWHIFANEYERRKHSLQTGTLYERFMQLAQEHCMTEREV